MEAHDGGQQLLAQAQAQELQYRVATRPHPLHSVQLAQLGPLVALLLAQGRLPLHLAVVQAVVRVQVRVQALATTLGLRPPRSSLLA